MQKPDAHHYSAEREFRMTGRDTDAFGTERAFVRRLFLTLTILFIGLFLALLLWVASDFVFLIFAALLIAVFLRGLANLVSRRSGLGVGLSLILVILLLTCTFAGLVVLLSPEISKQSAELATTFPQAVESMRAKLDEYAWGHWILEQIPDSDEIGKDGISISRVTGLFSSTFGLLTDMILVTIVGIYLAATPRQYKNGFVMLFPKRRRRRMGQIIDEVVYTLQWWLVGQFIAMAIIAVLTGIGLWLLDIPLGMTLALLSGLLNFVPNLGPLVAMIPPALLGLMVSPAKMVYVIILYLSVQTLESYIITPKIQEKAVSLPPALTILSQILMGVLFGLPGLIFATPITAVVLVVVKMAYIEDVLDDDVELPSEKAENEKNEREGDRSAETYKEELGRSLTESKKKPKSEE